MISIYTGGLLDDEERPPPPGRIGPYRIDAEIARGGMGVVYAAWDEGLERRVAIKLLLGFEHGRTFIRERRFVLESEALARVRHPHVVPIHSAGTEAGTPYLVMDLIEGESLQARIVRAGPLSDEETARIGVALAGALGAAHAEGILHRDVKPDNVLITPGGSPLLTDFGLAKDLRSCARLSRTGAMLGTPGFWPPEQAQGRLDAIGPRSDVYGLGATLYACLTGVPPFYGLSEVDLLTRSHTLEPTPPRELNPDLDPALAAIVSRCMRKDPQARYASPVDLAEAVRGFLERRPTRRARLARTWGCGLAVLALAVAGGRWASSRPAPSPPAQAVVAAAQAPSRAAVERVPPGPLLVGRYRPSDRTWPETVRSDQLLARYPHADDGAPWVCLLGREIERTRAWGVTRGALVERRPPGEPFVLATSRTRALVRPNAGCGMVVVAPAQRAQEPALALTGYRPGAAITEAFSALVTWDERGGGSWRLLVRSKAGELEESHLTGFQPRRPHVRLLGGGRRLLIDQRHAGSSVALREWRGGALVPLARFPRGEFGAPLALSDDGERFACQRGRRIVVVRSERRALVASWPGVAASQVAFEPGGQRLAWVEGGQVVVADLRGRRRIELSVSARARWVRFCFLARGDVLVADSTGAARYRLPH